MDFSKLLLQLEFARTMSARQWALLEAATTISFPLSASEWVDGDFTALLRNGLAEFDRSTIEATPALHWMASDEGANLVQLKTEMPNWPDLQVGARRDT
jgi:hypothetical protein